MISLTEAVWVHGGDGGVLLSLCMHNSRWYFNILLQPKQDVWDDADSCNKLFAVSSPTILDSKHHLASLILSCNLQPGANTFYTLVIYKLISLSRNTQYYIKVKNVFSIDIDKKVY